METDFIDNNTLMVRDCNIKYGDKVVVCQQDADGVILTQTDEFTYSEDEIKPPIIRHLKQKRRKQLKSQRNLKSQRKIRKQKQLLNKRI